MSSKMSSKVRSLARGIARYNIQQQEIPLFGKYVKSEIQKSQRGKMRKVETMRSYFARSWRGWL